MRLLTSCVIALALTPSLGLAQKYQCGDEERSGLIWKAGNWQQYSFKLELGFFLEIDTKGKLTQESLSEALRTPSEGIICHPPTGNKISCVTIAGRSLIFDTNTHQGARSSIFGGTNADKDRRDALMVAPFVCKKAH